MTLTGCAAVLLSLSLASCGDNEAGSSDEVAGGGTAGDPSAIYTAPDGRANATGAIDSPVDIYTAVAKVEAGGVIYMRGGVYYLTKGVDINKIGSEATPFRLWAYGNEKPVFDCSQETVPAANNLGIRMTSGQWWHIRGLEIRNANNSGFALRDASHNTFERCVAHHNGGSGFHIGYDHGDRVNIDGEKAAYNTFLNCDAYNNFDWYATNGSQPAAGTNADGFACKSCTGKGNRYIGCRAWSNSDDNWDFFECGYGIQLIDCWAWNAGVMSDHLEMYFDRTGQALTAAVWDGNGNGFKIGGGCLMQPDRECNLESLGTHILRNCIAFNNNVNGFDQNSHRYGAVIENCVSFNNGGRNFTFYIANQNGTSFAFRNNVAWGSGKVDAFTAITISADEGNLWNQPALTSTPAAEFVSLMPDNAKAARNADGSLPTGFARLKPSSVFIDKGVLTPAINHAFDDISLPPITYLGDAPDLGAFEEK
jgi:hypothetical protein